MNCHVPINNSIEGWHRSSQAHVLAYHPVFRKLLSVLQKEKMYDSYIYCLQVKEFSKLLAIIQIGKGFNNWERINNQENTLISIANINDRVSCPWFLCSFYIVENAFKLGLIAEVSLISASCIQHASRQTLKEYHQTPDFLTFPHNINAISADTKGINKVSALLLTDIYWGFFGIF